MSAPDTNVEKQKRFHKGPLIGMAAAVVFALTLLILWLTYEVEGSESSNENTNPEVPTLTDEVNPDVVAPDANSTNDRATDAP